MKRHSQHRQSGTISPKLTLSLLGILFLVPLTVAWLMYAGIIEYQPGASVNHGTLVNPPVKAEVPYQFAASGLTEHWVLTHMLPASCLDDCRQRLHGLRQVSRALGRDAARIRILLLLESPPDSGFLEEIEATNPGFSVIASNTGKLPRQLESLGDRHGIFIIDPLGNIMMRYSSESDPNDILSDLERLLQYQKTDPQ